MKRWNVNVHFDMVVNLDVEGETLPEALNLAEEEASSLPAADIVRYGSLCRIETCETDDGVDCGEGGLEHGFRFNKS